MKITKFIFLLLIVISVSSCEKWIDPEINVDPNNPDDVSMELLLPAIQGSWAYTFGGDFAMAPRIWMQHLGGADRQALAFDRYAITSADINNIWRFNTYATSLQDTKLLIEKAENENSPAYKGIAQVLWAYQFLTLTDYFGDIPYSEALDINIPQPKFDDVASIYADLVIKLDEAISNLGQESVLAPGADDMIFGGDLDMWIKAANAIKIRLFLRWGERDASKLSEIDGLIDQSFEEGENMYFQFGETETTANPLYQFIDQRSGYVFMGANLINALNGGTPGVLTDDDPRLSAIASQLEDTAIYVGQEVGQPGSQKSLPGDFFASIGSPVYFMTHAELKFIEAEISTGADRDIAYREAVTASLRMYGVLGDDPDWETENITNMSDVTLEDVINAKYLALALQPEVYTDYRRTGFPVLSTYEGQPIPKRFPYATASYNYNPDNVPDDVTKNTAIWWDVD